MGCLGRPMEPNASPTVRGFLFPIRIEGDQVELTLFFLNDNFESLTAPGSTLEDINIVLDRRLFLHILQKIPDAWQELYPSGNVVFLF